MKNNCNNLKIIYNQIKQLKDQLDSDITKQNVKDLQKAQKDIEEALVKVYGETRVIWFENEKREKTAFEIKKQYNEKLEILKNNKIIEKLPKCKEWGIIGIDGQEYPVPNLSDIRQEIRKNQEFFKLKMSQGFTQIEIVPFAMPLDKLIDITGKAILRHHKENKLFTAKKDPSDENEKLEPLELDENEPIWNWEGYDQADEKGTLAYYPKEYTDDQQGKTKKQIIQDPKQTFTGWNIILREENVNIPAENKGKTINKRKQIEANQSSNKYLKTIQTDKQYKGESGMTPEDQLTMFLTYLEQTNQAIDDYKGNGKASFQLGAFFSADGYVPHFYWYRDCQQAYLYRNDSGESNSNYGSRATARI